MKIYAKGRRKRWGNELEIRQEGLRDNNRVEEKPEGPRNSFRLALT